MTIDDLIAGLVAAAKAFVGVLDVPVVPPVVIPPPVIVPPVVVPPPIVLPPPTAPTGSIEIGDSGYRGIDVIGNVIKLTPDFHGHGMFDSQGPLWAELGRTVLNDTVDPKSAALIARMNGLSVHVDFFAGNTPDTLAPFWGLPINTVRGDQPMLRVDVPSGYPNESDQPIQVPMPYKPAIEGWLYTQNNQIGGAPNSTPPTFADIENNPSTDHHLFIAVRDEATGGVGDLIEMSKPWYDGAWHAKQISLFPANGIPRREGHTSTDAAGLPRLPLLPRYDECRTGVIRHPLAMTFTEGMVMGRYIWPARHSANGGDGLPFGARMRLTQAWFDAHKDQFTSDARVIVQAMRDYGVINTDIGGNLFLMGVSDSRFDHANLMSLQAIPNTAFEVLKMVPQFECVGPTTIPVGVEQTFTLKFNPPVEMNGQHGYYIHVFERNAANTGWQFIAKDANPHEVDYTRPDHDAPTFKFTAGKPGPMLIEVDQAGEAKLAWTAETQPIPGRGPYPYFQLTAV